MNMTERELLQLIKTREKNSIGSTAGAAGYSEGTPNDEEDVTSARARALDYYYGRPLGNEVKGRSQVVAQELRDTVEWAMPQIMRMFVSSREVVRFEPSASATVEDAQRDEEVAQQRTDVVNHKLMTENNGIIVLHDFFKDALLLENGYVRVYHEEVEEVTFEKYTGVTVDEITMIQLDILRQGGTAEVVEREEIAPNPVMTPEGVAVMPDITFDIRIKRTVKRPRDTVEPIPCEDMRVSADAKGDLQQASYVGHVVRKTRSEWASLGYDVKGIPASDDVQDQDELSRNHSIDEGAGDADGADKSMDVIDGLESYLRVDWDGDGYAELRHVLTAGNKVLENELLDEVPIAYCVPMRMPHRHLGISYYDLLKDLTEIKTTLLRQTLDNTYLVNNGRIAYNQKTVNGTDIITSRAGGGIRVDGPVVGQTEYLAPPPIAPQLLTVVNYMDTIKSQRTGISMSTQGLDPDVLQGSTASAYRDALNAANAKVEMIARMLAEGVRQIGVLLDHLVVKHQDKPLVIKLRGEWTSIDPTQWRGSFTCRPNVGLGTGSHGDMRENLRLLAQTQQAVAAVGLVGPQQAYESAAKIAEALGFDNPERFFVKPGSPEWQQMHNRPAQPDPKMEIERMKAEAALRKEQISTQGDIERELIQQRSDITELGIRREIANTEARAQVLAANIGASSDQVQAFLEAKAKQDEALVRMLESAQRSQANEVAQ